jgi:hypothetical protein
MLTCVPKAALSFGEHISISFKGRSSRSCERSASRNIVTIDPMFRLTRSFGSIRGVSSTSHTQSASSACRCHSGSGRRSTKRSRPWYCHNSARVLEFEWQSAHRRLIQRARMRAAMRASCGVRKLEELGMAAAPGTSSVARPESIGVMPAEAASAWRCLLTLQRLCSACMCAAADW